MTATVNQTADPILDALQEVRDSHEVNMYASLDVVRYFKALHIHAGTVAFIERATYVEFLSAVAAVDARSPRDREAEHVNVCHMCSKFDVLGRAYDGKWSCTSHANF